MSHLAAFANCLHLLKNASICGKKLKLTVPTLRNKILCKGLISSAFTRLILCSTITKKYAVVYHAGKKVALNTTSQHNDVLKLIYMMKSKLT